MTAVACNLPPPVDSDAIEIRDVSVIDVTGGPVLEHITVSIRGNRIVEMSAAGSAESRRGIEVVDGRGKFLIPGLWDMHVHAFGYSFPSFFAPMMVAHGVTGAREMSFYADTALHWRAEVARGRVLGPRLVISLRIDGPSNPTPWVARAATAAQARAVVDSAARLGIDFIKVYSRLPRAAYFEVAREANARKIPFAGHVPYEVSMIEASRAGQRSVEHEDDLMRSCSSRDSVLRGELRDAATAPGRDTLELPMIRRHAAEMKATFDPALCSRVMAELAKNGSWVVPTLVVYAPYAANFDTSTTHPQLEKYLPPQMLGQWRRRASRMAVSDTAAVGAYFSFERTRDLRAANVRILAGTDTPLPYVFPGSSLHEELELLVRAGSTPMEAIQAATTSPAAFLGAADSLGSVKPGNVADLVLLDADPLADIRNTRRIHAVIVNGRLLRRDKLDSLLRSVEKSTHDR